uniref:midasin n=1 Tax=Myxine glutinosa TaxID=7769 RepID=UPI00358FB529
MASSEETPPDILMEICRDEQANGMEDPAMALDQLESLLLDPERALEVPRLARSLLLELLERVGSAVRLELNEYKESVKDAESDEGERYRTSAILGRHERLCVVLSRLLHISPDVENFVQRYFVSAPPPFARLFSTKCARGSWDTAAKEVATRTIAALHEATDSMAVALAELMRATYMLASVCPAAARWHWSACVPLLQHSEGAVRWFAARSLAVVTKMSDAEKDKLLNKILGEGELAEYRALLLAEILQREKDLNEMQSEGFPGQNGESSGEGVGLSKKRQSKLPIAGCPAIDGSNEPTGDVTSKLTASVNVCGVVLSRLSPVAVDEKRLPSLHPPLVMVSSTVRHLRSLALAVSGHRPVLLEGPVGCGKTALVEFLATQTGHVGCNRLLTVQLGDQTDSRALLGGYRCTDVPGEFEKVSGVLAFAARRGCWLLLEDLDCAPTDLISTLVPLLESGKLQIPGQAELLCAAPTFQLFATCRLQAGCLRGSRHTLLDKLWVRIVLDAMDQQELHEVLTTRYKTPGPVADRLVTIFVNIAGGAANEQEDKGDCSAATEPRPRRRSPVGRPFSLRDLLKWCERVSGWFNNSIEVNTLPIFQEALDCFCAAVPLAEMRQSLAETIGVELNVIREKVDYFCRHYKPAISVDETHVTVGRITLQRKLQEAVQITREQGVFADTRPACVLLEQLSGCLCRAEPVLLVGETGTGKTSTVQHLARLLGKKLRAINMGQHSDSTELLGGYRPAEPRALILPIREAFEELFVTSFSRRQNIGFLGHIASCTRQRLWKRLLLLMLHVQRAAICRPLSAEAMQVRERWKELGVRLRRVKRQLKFADSAPLFSFVEGGLVRAVRRGDWLLLDEINLASAETLEGLAGLLESAGSSVVLLDRGDSEPIPRHPDFRLFACMNPATDVGKKELPPGIRNRFTEIFVDEIEQPADLTVMVSSYLAGHGARPHLVQSIVRLYLAVREIARDKLKDGTGRAPHYSLRSLCRALAYAADNPCGNLRRSLYEGLCLSFLSQLERVSQASVEQLIVSHILGRDARGLLLQPLPEPPGGGHTLVAGYWLPMGELDPYEEIGYVITPTVKDNLRQLSRAVSASRYPVLLQGETSVGKTSLVQWLAAATGNSCVRINNHEHTDLQEYLGCFAADANGRLAFQEGVLLRAVRNGSWVVLDELNLAPSDVLEALNRLLDDNRELRVPETEEVVQAHPRFALFATQNPPGLYGGRKVLSRAFRNRFVELHLGELPSVELQMILHERCHLPPSYCLRLVQVMLDLQAYRRGSSVFAGKYGYITLRDLFRWAERYRQAKPTSDSYDWLQYLANDGYRLLAGRVRKDEEAAVIRSVIEKHFRRTVSPNNLFSEHNLKDILQRWNSRPEIPSEFRHLVWTAGLRRMAALLSRALEHREPVLLVGGTGCGKTTMCQLFAALAGRPLHSLNCHQHLDTADLLGGLRPARHSGQDVERGRLFEWQDGPLVLAMRHDGFFLLDEISLADDSVLERLNSVLEPERSLVLVEKGGGDNDRAGVDVVKAGPAFAIVATMNPGGDYGKKELSPALRNRFTEVWCPSILEPKDLAAIVKHNLAPGLGLGCNDHQGAELAAAILDFSRWLQAREFGRCFSLTARDLLTWVSFMNTTAATAVEGVGETNKVEPISAFIHAACLVCIDGIGSAGFSGQAKAVSEARQSCLAFLQARMAHVTDLSSMALALLNPSTSGPATQLECQHGRFGIPPFFIDTGPSLDAFIPRGYSLMAPTPARNAARLLRALQLGRPILLEGAPGVGKTSLVAAIARGAGHPLVRINLSEHTDVSDLFGADLPVEGGRGGEFAWRDGPLLAALRAGHWIMLDELNLASQSVLEGLNACLDHRGEIFVPELGTTFHLRRGETRVFGCQNPLQQGGGRRGLPRSFLNRFTQVYVDHLSAADMELISGSMYPSLDPSLVGKIVEFNNQLCDAVLEKRCWGLLGGPWEFNLRDVLRWCELAAEETESGPKRLGQHLGLVYAERMRSLEDRRQVYSLFARVFGFDNYEELVEGPRGPLHVTPETLQVGSSILVRGEASGHDYNLGLKRALCLHPGWLCRLELLSKAAERAWPVLLVGSAGSGKSSLVQGLARLAGRKLVLLSMNSAMDASEMLGGFEQADILRPWQDLRSRLRDALAHVIRAALLSMPTGFGICPTDTIPNTVPHGLSCARRLLDIHSALAAVFLGDEERPTLAEAHKRLEVLEELEKMHKELNVLPTSILTELRELASDVAKRVAGSEGGKAAGAFEWVDGPLVQALRAGHWLLMDNVNFCSPAVLDRLNAVLEPDGVLVLGERGVLDGSVPTVVPHPDFRVFMTMDPSHGEISRAMRNRSAEIYLHGFVPGPEGFGPAPDQDPNTDLCTDLDEFPPVQVASELKPTSKKHGPIPVFEPGGPWWDLRLLLQSRGLVAGGMCDFMLQLQVMMGHDVQVADITGLISSADAALQRWRCGWAPLHALALTSVQTWAATGQFSTSRQALVKDQLSRLLLEIGDVSTHVPALWPGVATSLRELSKDWRLCSLWQDSLALLHCLSRFARHSGAISHYEVDTRLISATAWLVMERAGMGDWHVRVAWLKFLSGKQTVGKVQRLLGEAAAIISTIWESPLVHRLWSCIKEYSSFEACKLVLGSPLDLRWDVPLLDQLHHLSHKRDGQLVFGARFTSLANRLWLLLTCEQQGGREQWELQRLASGQLKVRGVLGTAQVLRAGELPKDTCPHPLVRLTLNFLESWLSAIQFAANSEEHLFTDSALAQIEQCLEHREWFWEACAVSSCGEGILGNLALHWAWLEESVPQSLLLLTGTTQLPDDLNDNLAAMKHYLHTGDDSSAALGSLQKAWGRPLPYKLPEALEVLQYIGEVRSHLIMPSAPPQSEFEAQQQLSKVWLLSNASSLQQSLVKAWGLLELSRKCSAAETGTEAKSLQETFVATRELCQHFGLSTGHGPRDCVARNETHFDVATLQQLEMKVQLLPTMEHVGLAAQYGVCAQLLDLLTTERKEDDLLGTSVEQLLAFQMSLPSSTPDSLGIFWALMHGQEMLHNAVQFTWPGILLAALSSLWSGVLAADGPWWASWQAKVNNTSFSQGSTGKNRLVQGPAVLSSTGLSLCVFPLVNPEETRHQWLDPSLCGRVALGAWRSQLAQLDHLSSLLWAGLSPSILLDFRKADSYFLRVLLKAHLAFTTSSLQPSGADQPSSSPNCSTLVELQDGLSALAQNPSVPKEVADLLARLAEECGTEEQDYGLGEAKRRARLWVYLGLLTLLVWRPRSLFDPTLKHACKLRHAQHKLERLTSEIQARDLDARLLTGLALQERSRSHPRIRHILHCKAEMQKQISALERKQALRPSPLAYAHLVRDAEHFFVDLCSAERVCNLLESLLNDGAASGLLREEAAWQASALSFAHRLSRQHSGLPDIALPLRAGIAQVQHGLRLAAMELHRTLEEKAEQKSSAIGLLTCIARFPTVCEAFPSALALAQALCNEPQAPEIVAQALAQERKGESDQESEQDEGAERILLLALLFLQSHARLIGYFDHTTVQLTRHLCQVLARFWEEKNQSLREKEYEQQSLYRFRSEQHLSGLAVVDLNEDEEEERAFQLTFPQHYNDFPDQEAPSQEESTILNPPPKDGDETYHRYGKGSMCPQSVQTLLRVHQEVYLGLTTAPWLQPSGLDHRIEDHLVSLLPAYRLTATLVLNTAFNAGEDFDRDLLGSHLLMSQLPRIAVRLKSQEGGSDDDAEIGFGLERPGVPYDFYRSPCPEQSTRCLSPLNSLRVRVCQLMDEWPDHPALQQIVVIVDRMLTFPLSSPLSKFICGLEILLAKAQDWETVACRRVSLQAQLDDITHLVIEFRKLELSCWFSLLDATEVRYKERDVDSWLAIYQLIEGPGGDETWQQGAVETLQAWMEGATLGQFSRRLTSLLTFHCQMLHHPDHHRKEHLTNVLWNLYRYYHQFLNTIQARLALQRREIERGLKDFVKICRWNDRSFWAVKMVVEKTHRILFKFVRKFESVLAEPCRLSLTEQTLHLAETQEEAEGKRSRKKQPRKRQVAAGSRGNGKRRRQHVEQNAETSQCAADAQLCGKREEESEEEEERIYGKGEDIDKETGNKLLELLRAAKVSTSIPACIEALVLEPATGSQDALSVRLPHLLSRAGQFCAELSGCSKIARSIHDLDLFTGVVLASAKDLAGLTVNSQASREAQRAQAKQQHMHKQRALSDLFRTLRSAGLSYRKGLVWSRSASSFAFLRLAPLSMPNRFVKAPVQKAVISELNLGLEHEEEVEQGWQDCERYFYRALARRSALHAASAAPAKDVGPARAERCRGLSEHLMLLLLDERERLAILLDHHHQLGGLVLAVHSVANGRQTRHARPLPPQAEVETWLSRLDVVLVQAQAALEQTQLLLLCCPTLNDNNSASSSQAVTLAEGTVGTCGSDLGPMSPVPSVLMPMVCNLRKGDPSWDQTTGVVKDLIRETQRLRQPLEESRATTKPNFITWASVTRWMEGVTTLTEGLRDLHHLFVLQPETGPGPCDTSSSIAQSLNFVLDQITVTTEDFQIWRDKVSLAGGCHLPREDFRSDLDDFISLVLCVIQSLIKKKRESEFEVDDAIKERLGELADGHISRTIMENMKIEISLLSMPRIISSLSSLLEPTKSADFSSEVVSDCASGLATILPLVWTYHNLVSYYMALALASHRTSAKLLTSLLAIFTQLMQKGFCQPEELSDEGTAHEGGTQFVDIEGGGIGEGEGTKDVSEQIETEDQLEDTTTPGQDTEKEPPTKDLPDEDHAVEMSEDFDGRLHDADERKEGEEEANESEESDGSEEELEKQMGDLGDGETEKLDERLWGEDDKEDDGKSGETEETGPGAGEQESKLVPKDDNSDDQNKRKEKHEEEKKNQKSEDEGDEEKMENDDNVHEQMDEREYDDTETDPYHGGPDPPQPEPLDLSEKLDLDRGGESGGEENEPEVDAFDIEEKHPEVREHEGQQSEDEVGDEGEGETEGETAQSLDDGGEKQEEEENKDDKTEENGDKEGSDGEQQEEASEEKDEKEDKTNGEKSTRPDDLPTQPPEPKQEGHGEGDAESDEREERGPADYETKSRTGEQSLQSELARERAGISTEDAQGSEELGDGNAESGEAEGHACERKTRFTHLDSHHTDSRQYKRKPGFVDQDRTLSSQEDRVSKRLKTTQSSDQNPPFSEEGKRPPIEAEQYQHVAEADGQFDKATWDAATVEQQQQCGGEGNEEEEQTEGTEDVPEDADEQDLEGAPEHIQSSKVLKNNKERPSDGEQGSEEVGKELDAIEETMEDRLNLTKSSRSKESTFHTAVWPLPETTPLQDPEELRRELQEQLEAWASQPFIQEEAAMVETWRRYLQLTAPLAQHLCEQLRLVLEPTQAAELRGDYRTGKRLNMRKVIPYIASQFRKDKIWLRRTKPSKRTYQVCLAIDDSSSMMSNRSKQLAFESLAVIGSALGLLEVGQVSVCSFGEDVQLLHPFHEPFTEQAGARILQRCSFQQRQTRVAQFLEAVVGMFSSARWNSLHRATAHPETNQLLLVVSDGRGLFLEGRRRVEMAVQAARQAQIFVIFVILDNPDSQHSVVDIRVPIFGKPGEAPEIRSYLEDFPFPFYLILRDAAALPTTLGDALRQWFELVTSM